jgi:exodeoxyribonuclease VII small subunit
METTRMATREDGTAKGREARSFEQSLARLEAIVREMEGGELGLEDMIGRFEEGQGLLKFCGRKLDEVERRIEILVKKGETVEAQPFGEEAGGADEEESDELF